MVKGPEYIRDPIHNFIKLNPVEREIINSSQFQRLRRIKQLGPTYYVYPGATHSRFEHSIGTMHIGTRMLESIFDKHCGKGEIFEGIDKNRFEKMIRIALLLHDIGHPPFSHAAEKELLPVDESTKKNLKHEEYCLKIINNTNLKGIISEFGKDDNITSDHISFIVSGDKYGPKYLNKIIKSENNDINKFIFQILNKIVDSNFDADKIDYLIRDSYYCGVEYGRFDFNRLINKLDLSGIDEKGNIESINLAIQLGGINSAEGLAIARYHMFDQVYFHKLRRVYDKILERAIKETIGEFPLDVQDYLNLDDVYLSNLFKENMESKKWCYRFYNRDHFKCKYDKIFFKGDSDTNLVYNINKFKQEVKEDKKLFNKVIYDESDDLSISRFQPFEISDNIEQDIQKCIFVIDESDRDKKILIQNESMIFKNLDSKMKNIVRIYTSSENQWKKIEKDYNLYS